MVESMRRHGRTQLMKRMKNLESFRYLVRSTSGCNSMIDLYITRCRYN